MSGSNDLLGDLVAEAQQGARGETGALELLERETDMRNLSKKAKTIIAGAAIAGLASTGVAYAYWTTSGAGNGSAANASSNGSVVVYAAFDDGLTPGGSTTVTYTASNLNTSNLYITTIHAVPSIDATHAALGCLATDFTIDDITSNTMVPAGTIPADAVPAGEGTLSFANTDVPQNGCKGATVTLTLSTGSTL